MATPSASFSLRTFSNISSVDHRLILVDKTGLFCFLFVNFTCFFLEVVLFHLKSNSRKSLSTRKHFLAVLFFPQGFISRQLVSEANVSHFIEQLKIFPRNRICLRDDGWHGFYKNILLGPDQFGLTLSLYSVVQLSKTCSGYFGSSQYAND